LKLRSCLITEVSQPRGSLRRLARNNSLDAFFQIDATSQFPVLPAGKADDGTLKLTMDSEGLIYNKNDKSWFISDEYGRISFVVSLTIAYIYHFTSEGHLTDVIVPPEAFIPMRNGVESFSANSPPIDDPTQLPSPANPTTGRQDNQGFEGVTISPDGKTLFVLLQSAAIQDTGSSIAATRRNTRMLSWDFATKTWTGEWAVQLPNYNDSGIKVAAQSEMHCLDKNRFLVLARDSSHGYGFPASASIYRQVPSSLLMR
jgi:hypothetical protein